MRARRFNLKRTFGWEVASFVGHARPEVFVLSFPRASRSFPHEPSYGVGWRTGPRGHRSGALRTRLRPVLPRRPCRGTNFPQRQRLSRQIQSVVATPGCCSEQNCSAKTSAGVHQSWIWRGRLLIARATASRSSADPLDRSVSFGKYWRSKPFEFSLVGHCQGECESAKNTLMPVSRANWA